ncbi:hypothetical protein, partial [Streptomyces sp. FH025]|uniref:hypothetical protein n=1 Tax=Streptomyces sp. FH025 TaxID=2815937 RepID=UPI001A9F5BB6
MFTHSSSRRPRLVAAAALVVATGTTALAPATAFADTPAPGDTKPLVATLTPNAGQAPLVRSGNGAEMTLTVTNDSDQEQPFHPAVNVKPVNSGFTGWYWINFDAKAISAPPTSGVETYGQNGFAGFVVPERHMSATSFKVPAHTTYSWALSFKVKSALPAEDTAVRFELVNDQNDSTDSDPVTLPVIAPTGALVQSFGNTSGTASYKQSYEADLFLANNGAAINAGINPTLRLGDGSHPIPATLKLDVLQDGKWTTVPGTNNVWKLPTVVGGLGKGARHDYRIRLSVADSTGPGRWFSESLSLTPDTDQGPVD